MLAEADPQLSREIRQVMFEALSRLQAQLMILGRITATEKVSSFLLTMAERLSDQTLDRVDLPISRYDIADYLGLSVETVSRSLTSLKNRGLIALSGPRSVRIIDRDALEEGGACNAYPKQLGARRGSDNLSTRSSRAVRANIRSAERLSYLSRAPLSRFPASERPTITPLTSGASRLLPSLKHVHESRLVTPAAIAGLI